jgi:hypothetical protein
MPTIDARCTQCGSEEHGDPTKNNNYVTYHVSRSALKHGTGRAHGTELFECSTCGETTVHNRCGSSVPRDGATTIGP